MTDYVKRLDAEFWELHDKCNKLGAFLDGEQFKLLSKTKQELMQDQLQVMQKYLIILLKRIDRETYPDRYADEV